MLDEVANIVDSSQMTDMDVITGLATDIHGQDATSEKWNVVYSVRSVNESGTMYRKVIGEDAIKIFDLSGKSLSVQIVKHVSRHFPYLNKQEGLRQKFQ